MANMNSMSLPTVGSFLTATSGTNGSTALSNGSTSSLGLPNATAMSSLPLQQALSMAPDSKGAPSIPLLPVLLTPNDAIRALASAASNGAAAPSTQPAVNPLAAMGGLSNPAPNANLLSLLAAAKEANGGTAASTMTAAEKEAAELRQELDRERNKMQLIQTAYWSLRADFDNVCDVIKSMESNKAASVEMGKNATAMAAGPTKKSGLDTITEGESLDLKEELQQKLKEQEEEIARLEVEKDGTVHLLTVQIQQMHRDHEAAKKAHQKTVDALKKKNKESNKKVNALEKDIKNLKHKIKKCEKEKTKMATVHATECTKKTIKKDLLCELYLNSSRIREFMAAVKKYGDHFKALKQREADFAAAIGAEDADTLRLRMGDLSSDIFGAEQSYREIYEALDMMKTESQGKELEVMTKDKEYIDLLEKEKFVQSSHLEEYVKKNQTLQLDLTDREMKLRQAQNELNHFKQRIAKLEAQSNGMMQQQQQQQQRRGGHMNPMMAQPMVNGHGFTQQMNMNCNVNMFSGPPPQFMNPMAMPMATPYAVYPQYAQ